MFEFQQKISKELYEKKYKHKTDKTVQDTFKRVAHEISLAEDKAKRAVWEETFYNLMDSGKLIPAGRIMDNAGTEFKYYNNCYSIAIEDSLDRIYDALKDDAMISKAGGGVGFDISTLRPKDSILSKGGKSSGPLSFLEVFNASAKVIETGGGRRSAHICLMDISHPDIKEFIICKQGDNNDRFTQFNMSVKITDKFMDAVKNNKKWNLEWGGKVYETVKARELFDSLCEHAFIHNEPGLFFVDNVNKYNNGAYEFSINTCNPCGELPLPAYSLCCLSSLNLTSFVKDPFSEKPEFDLKDFKEAVKISVRFLDNVLDRTKYPIDLIKENSLKYRRIGLGFTGLGDTFAMLKVKYGSKESQELSHKIAGALRNYSYEASVELAKEKGKFPNYKNDVLESPFIKRLDKQLQEEIKKDGLRNIALNTCAPTGTTSIVFGNNCSSGIEPIFDLEFSRSIRTGKGDDTVTEDIQDYAWMVYKNVNNIKGKYGDITFKSNRELVKEIFATAGEIDPREHLEIQAIFQQYIDSSISKTNNLPNDYDITKYKDLLNTAYNKEVKGFTTYNPNGSMKGILESKYRKDRPAMVVRSEAPLRPSDLACDIHSLTVTTDGKKDEFVILVGLLNGCLYELFAGRLRGHENMAKYKTGILSKKGKGVYSLSLDLGGDKLIVDDILSTFPNKSYNTITRLISMSLRHGTPLEFIVSQLQRDSNFTGFERALSRVIKKYIKDGELVKSSVECPECGSSAFIFESGCQKCSACGWSRCD